jgi:hypothetical protein
MPIDSKTTETILNADLANILKKVKAGKPLTKEERERIEAAQAEEPSKAASALESLTVSAHELETVTELTDRRHRQLAQEGVMPAKKKGRYNLVAAFQALLKYYREAAERAQDGLRQEQEDLTRTRNEIAKDDLMTRRREKIAKAEVKAALENWLPQFRADILKIETELASKLPMLTTIEQAQEIQACIDKAFESANRNLEKWLASPTTL